MYIETIKNLFADEVAETIAAIGTTQVIEFGKYTYEIPQNIVRSGYHRVMEWREKVLHGITGSMSMRETETGLVCGEMPVWTLHNMLAHETFTIRSANPSAGITIIHNAQELAEYLDTTLENLPEHVRMYHDYETSIELADDAITLRTIAGETGKELCKELYFPFSDEAYEDAHVGLQCWADATYWDAVHNGEV